MNQEYVGAARPVAPYQGGKKVLSKTIIERIERIDHACYVEPFVGMGGVFLRRAYRPKTEVINDINGEIINLFRILQVHYVAFMDMLKFQISSRKEFERLKNTRPETLTDLQRSARFLYIQRHCFGGNTSGVFGVSTTHSARFNITKLAPILEAAHERLAGVVFENLDWANLVTRYDSKDTLFYLDPPYWGCEQDYGKGIFARTDFAHMADRLQKIKGKFLLSINDRPEIREMFSWAFIDEVRLTYTISRKTLEKKACELIISNEKFTTGLF